MEIEIKFVTKFSIKWWWFLALTLFSNVSIAQPDLPPFWLNEINDANRVTPANRNRPGEDTYNFNNFDRDRDNVRHFYPLNLVQGQQVYSNSSGHM